MRCPRLSELPAPPPGRTGWPWTEESPPVPDRLPDGRPWPRVTIVTPSYNQGQFIEETIRSVLLQGYPDLEYLVVDGGSSDGSVDVIRKYYRWLAYWVSEPDRGQAHAINKGFSRSTGDLLAWINSDDFYFPCALDRLAESHLEHPEAILLADAERFDDGGQGVWQIRQSNVTFRNLVVRERERFSWNQPGLVVPRSLFLSAGPLDEGLRYAFDYDWLCRLTQSAPVCYLGVAVARFRVHATQKTTAEIPAATREDGEVARRYWEKIPELDARYMSALHGVRLASVYLGYHPQYARFWDRGTGIRQLFTTWRRYPRIAFLPDFRRLCLRAVLPKALFRSSPWRSLPG